MGSSITAYHFSRSFIVCYRQKGPKAIFHLFGPSAIGWGGAYRTCCCLWYYVMVAVEVHIFVMDIPAKLLQYNTNIYQV